MLIVGQLVTPNTNCKGNSKWTHQVLKFANIEGIVSMVRKVCQNCNSKHNFKN